MALGTPGPREVGPDSGEYAGDERDDADSNRRVRRTLEK